MHVGGVTIIGYTDLPSRLATQSSTLFSNNITKYLLSMSPKEGYFGIDLKDEVVRRSIVTHNGQLMPPLPPLAPPAPAAKAAEVVEETAVVALTPWQKATREGTNQLEGILSNSSVLTTASIVATITGGMGTALALGKLTGPIFMSNLFTFSLAGLIGYRVVWGVAPALHSPLMSVTNAISGMVGIGGRFENAEPYNIYAKANKRQASSLWAAATCPKLSLKLSEPPRSSWPLSTSLAGL